MLRSIRVRNLRAITDLAVQDLGQVNLFVGDNNSCKTTLLEGIFLLMGANNPEHLFTLNAFRGLNVVNNDVFSTFFHNLDASIPAEISFDTDDREDEHRLRISPITTQDTLIDHTGMNHRSPEAIQDASFATTSSGDYIAGRHIEDSPRLTGIQFEYIHLSSGESVITSSIRLGPKGLETESEQRKAPIKGVFVSPAHPGESKRRFGNVQRGKRVQDVVSLLRKIAPEITDLRLNEAGIIEADTGGAMLVPVTLMGGGTARLLTVALALLDSENGIVLIDECENGLYYGAQELLWEAIHNWAREMDVQVFATTHSKECISAFSRSMKASSLFHNDARFFRIEREKEQFRTVKYDVDLLSESIESGWEVR